MTSISRLVASQPSLFPAPLGEGGRLEARRGAVPPPPAQDPLVGLAHEAHELHDADEAEPDAEAHQAAHVGHEAERKGEMQPKYFYLIVIVS